MQHMVFLIPLKNMQNMVFLIPLKNTQNMVFLIPLSSVLDFSKKQIFLPKLWIWVLLILQNKKTNSSNNIWNGDSSCDIAQLAF